MALELYNTLGRKKEIFEPINKDLVGMYNCGPTVYNYAHIGNLRPYVFADILRRTLEWNGYKVEQVINITDIGHLVSDGDLGEDKMTKGLIREGKPLTMEGMKELADFYTEKFVEDLNALNIKQPNHLPKASEHIRRDIELVETLEKKGFVYKISDGVYFDTERLADYGKLLGKKTDDGESRLAPNSEKKNARDFALWKFSSGEMGYPSPWGQGFPGWHIECSAMGMKYLGEQFDLHTGGIDHIPVHHTNEIAQSEAATGKIPFVKYWLHSEFVNIANGKSNGGEKMAKSEDNFLKLSSITEKNISPLAYRLWLLMAHYRSPVSFNWEALEGVNTALSKLQEQFLALSHKSDLLGTISPTYGEKFEAFINDDLDTPRAVASLFELMKDETISAETKRATILKMDEVLGLGFADLKEMEIPSAVADLIKARNQARAEKDFAKSDSLREEIENLGYLVKDTADGQKVSKK